MARYFLLTPVPVKQSRLRRAGSVVGDGSVAGFGTGRARSEHDRDLAACARRERALVAVLGRDREVTLLVPEMERD